MNESIYRKYVTRHISLAAKVTLYLQTKQKYLPLHICMSTNVSRVAPFHNRFQFNNNQRFFSLPKHIVFYHFSRLIVNIRLINQSKQTNETTLFHDIFRKSAKRPRTLMKRLTIMANATQFYIPVIYTLSVHTKIITTKHSNYYYSLRPFCTIFVTSFVYAKW